MDNKSTADPTKIRAMNLETDFAQVKELWVKSVEKTAPPLKSGQTWKSKLHNLESEARDSRNQKYVYEEGGTIKGFIIAGILNGSPYLYELYVHSDFRHEGIGTQLLDKIRKMYRYLDSHVYECNPYLNFYLHHGFGRSGEKLCPDTGEIKVSIRWQSGENIA